MIHNVEDMCNCGYMSIHIGLSLTKNDVTYEDIFNGDIIEEKGFQLSFQKWTEKKTADLVVRGERGKQEIKKPGKNLAPIQSSVNIKKKKRGKNRRFSCERRKR